MQNILQNVWPEKTTLSNCYQKSILRVLGRTFSVNSWWWYYNNIVWSKTVSKPTIETDNAENVLAKIQLSSLTYGIVNINKHITYITNEVLTSRHDWIFERYTCELDLPKKLAGCRLYTRYCSMYPKKTCPFYILYCTKQSHSLFGETQLTMYRSITQIF